MENYLVNFFNFLLCCVVLCCCFQGKQGQGYYLDKRHPGYKGLLGLSRSGKKQKQKHGQDATPSPASSSTAKKSAKKSKKDNKATQDEENRRVRFGKNIAKGA